MALNIAVGRLSESEREIVARFSRGLTYEQAAFDLHMPPGTLNTHVLRMYRRLGVHSMAALIAQCSYEPITRRRITKPGKSVHQQPLWDLTG